MDWNAVYSISDYQSINAIIADPVKFIDAACRFKLYAHQSYYMDFINTYDKTISIKSRQCGISITTMYYLYWYAINNENANIYVYAPNSRLGTELVRKIQDAIISGPTFFNSLILSSRQDQLTFMNGSTITSISSPSQAINCMRGSNIDIFYIDEMSYINNHHLEPLTQLVLYHNIAKVIIATTLTEKNGYFTNFLKKSEFEKLIISNNTPPLQYSSSDEYTCDIAKRLLLNVL